MKERLIAADAELVLEGETVRLEPLRREHLPDLLEVGLDPELWRWTLTRVRDADDLERWLEAALTERERGDGYPFATVERASGRVVGSTRYTAIVPRHRRLEIGYTWVARSWQRTAVNTEAKYLMLRHAFEVLDLHRVEFKTDVLNERSRRALLRIGATEEGVLREHSIATDGRIRDTIYYSILAPEWPALAERLASYSTSSIGRNTPASTSSTSTRPSSMT